MAKVIIIGKGPAGISAALYTKRGNIDTLIIGRDAGALGRTEKIENFYGFPEPIGGQELLERGIANAKRLGCELLDDEVVGISYDGNFNVHTKNQIHNCDAVILATGAQRNTPKIPGIKEYEGTGVSYCAVCDAFFYRKKAVAVLGNGDYALHEAMELAPTVASVTLLTNGREPTIQVPDGIPVDKRVIQCLKGENVLSEVRFTDGPSLPVAGLFVAEGVATSGDLARKLGAQTDENRIVVNTNMETTIPGLYAAGDCIGGLLQIAKAVSDGAIAGTQAIKFLRQKK